LILDRNSLVYERRTVSNNVDTKIKVAAAKERHTIFVVELGSAYFVDIIGTPKSLPSGLCSAVPMSRLFPDVYPGTVYYRSE
jgi:hypothetical protein